MLEWVFFLGCLFLGYLLSRKTQLVTRRLTQSDSNAVWLLITFSLVLVGSKALKVGIPSVGLSVMSADQATKFATYFILAILVFLLVRVIKG